MLVRSCFLITLIKCLKGHKSLGSLCNVKSKSQWVSQWVTRSPIEQLWTAKNSLWPPSPTQFNTAWALFPQCNVLNTHVLVEIIILIFQAKHVLVPEVALIPDLLPSHAAVWNIQWSLLLGTSPVLTPTTATWTSSPWSQPLSRQPTAATRESGKESKLPNWIFLNQELFTQTVWSNLAMCHLMLLCPFLPQTGVTLW